MIPFLITDISNTIDYSLRLQLKKEKTSVPLNKLGTLI